MVEIINKYGVYGKYIFLICMIICIIFFLKKKGIMSENKFKPLSDNNDFRNNTICRSWNYSYNDCNNEVYGIALNTEIILMKAT